MLPQWLSLTWVTAVGACVGSFLNVVIARLPEEESIVHPRSRCPGCKTPIAWYDNIPVLSWVLLRGRCRACKQRIAVRYPLVEILMAALSAALFLRFGFSWELLVWWPLSAALLAVAFLDIDHWWVPDRITFPAMGFALATSFLPDGVTPIESILGLGPAALLWAVGAVFLRLTGKEGMGFGDVKLLVVMGLALGAMDALVVLLLASVQGAVIGLMVTLTGGHHTAENPADRTPGGEPGHADGRPDEAAAPADEAAAPADEAAAPADEAAAPADDDDWEPPPGAFPFGPFLVLGAFELVLLPEYFGDLLPRLTERVLGF